MEKKYTRAQIKDAIWQELQESDYTGENNDRAYEIIGIVLAGIDKIIVSTPKPGLPPMPEPILTDEDVKDWERENKCICNEPYDSEKHEGGYPACPVHDKPAVAHEPNLAVIGHGTPEIKKRQGPVWPLFVIDKATGGRHEVNKIVYHPENDPAPHIWCDTWYGHHVIGQDCEWLDESAPSGEISQDAHEKEVMMSAFNEVRRIFEGRVWIMEGRGSYPYNDDRYREEVRYMYNEFDELHKNTWANIKSHSSEYRHAIIEQYLKEKGKSAPSGEREVGSARYELSLALRSILRMIRHMPLKRDEQKRYEAAEAMLNKHASIYDVLRTGSKEGSKEMEINEAFIEWACLHYTPYYKGNKLVAWKGYVADGDEIGLTTAQLYDIFKQQNRNNANS